jgi:hypothetical protein
MALKLLVLSGLARVGCLFIPCGLMLTMPTPQLKRPTVFWASRYGFLRARLFLDRKMPPQFLMLSPDDDSPDDVLSLRTALTKIRACPAFL